MFDNSEMQDFGNLTADEVGQFNAGVLFDEWNNVLTGRAYDEFTTTTMTKLDETMAGSQSNILKKGAEYLHYKMK